MKTYLEIRTPTGTGAGGIIVDELAYCAEVADRAEALTELAALRADEFAGVPHTAHTHAHGHDGNGEPIPCVMEALS